MASAVPPAAAPRKSDAVGDLLHALHQARLVDRVDAHLELVVGEAIEDAVDAARQLLNEVLELDGGAEEGADRQVAPELLARDVGGMPPDRGIGIEVRREHMPDLVQVEPATFKSISTARPTWGGSNDIS